MTTVEATFPDYRFLNRKWRQRLGNKATYPTLAWRRVGSSAVLKDTATEPQTPPPNRGKSRGRGVLRVTEYASLIPRKGKKEPGIRYFAHAPKITKISGKLPLTSVYLLTGLLHFEVLELRFSQKVARRLLQAVF